MNKCKRFRSLFEQDFREFVPDRIMGFEAQFDDTKSGTSAKARRRCYLDRGAGQLNDPTVTVACRYFMTGSGTHSMMEDGGDADEI